MLVCLTPGHSKPLGILLADIENGLLLRGKVSFHLTLLPVLCPLPQHRPAGFSLRLDSSGLNRNTLLLCGFQKRPRHCPHLQPQNLLILFLSFSFLKFILFFLIVGKLQCCAGFCHTTGISRSVVIIYVPSCFSLPHLLPLHLSRLSQSFRLSSLNHTATSH